MSDDDAWFAPKRFGYGASFPISWQGWLATLLYVAVIAGAAFAFRHQVLPLMAAVVPATILFVLVTVKKTRGGWHWRWNGKRND